MADRRQLYQYKGDRCSMCGMSVEEMIERFDNFHRIFELHHVDPGSKASDYDNLIRRTISTEQLDEVDKCILVCATCHRVVEQAGRRATMIARIEHSGKSAEQTLKGQLIYDGIDNEFTFLTNEQLRIWPYRVIVGSRLPRVMFGTELEPRLVGYLDRIDRHQLIIVQDTRDRPLMLVEYLERRRFRLKHHVRFPLVEAELREEVGTPITAWLRNGVYLGRQGNVVRDGWMTYEFAMRS